MREITMARLIQALEEAVESSRNGLHEWAEKLQDDPLYSFQWGERAIENAARVAVYERILVWAREGEGAEYVRVQAIRDEASITALRFLREGNSTSAMSNLATREEGKAWGALVEYLDGIKGWL